MYLCLMHLFNGILSQFCNPPVKKHCSVALGHYTGKKNIYKEKETLY